MSITLILASVSLFSFLIYKYVVFPAFFSPLSKIPNAHFTSPISPAWIWWRRRTQRENISILCAHREKGPIVRLGPNELSVSSIDSLRQVYTGGYIKTHFYVDEFQNFQTPNLISMLDHRPHSVQKRMLANIYSKSYLQGSLDLQIICRMMIYDRLLPLLHSRAENGAAVNVLELMLGTGMDFMSAYLFGLENGTDFIRDVVARKQHLEAYRIKAYLLPGADQAGKELEAHCLSMCQAAERTMAGTFQTTTKPVVYSKMFSELSKSDLSYASCPQRDMIAASEMLDHLLAGRETVGVTLSYLMLELSRRPELISKLRSELLTLSPQIIYLSTKGSNSNTNSLTLPSHQALDALPLLNAVVYETLRIHVITAGPQPRLTPPNATIEGYSNIPAGVRISSSAYSLHRNPEVFPDPEVFKPERWMPGMTTPSQSEAMRRWFWAFSNGGRMCIGNNFALLGG